MPRRKYVRDKIGRFSEVSGGGAKGRAPAIKKREGKNAVRREASAKLLKASRAKQAHEDFLEKALIKTPRDEAHKQQLRKQIANARAGIQREDAKRHDSRVAIAREREKIREERSLPNLLTSKKSIDPATGKVAARKAKKAQTPSKPSHPGTTTIKSTRAGREAARKERLRERSAEKRKLANDAFKSGASDFAKRAMRSADLLDKKANLKPQGKQSHLKSQPNLLTSKKSIDPATGNVAARKKPLTKLRPDSSTPLPHISTIQKSQPNLLTSKKSIDPATGNVAARKKSSGKRIR